MLHISVSFHLGKLHVLSEILCETACLKVKKNFEVRVYFVFINGLLTPSD